MESEKSAYEIETPHKGIPYVEFYETLQRMIKKCITDRYGNEFLPVCDETCKGLLTIPNTTGNAATSIEYNYDDYEVIKELIERINDYGAVLSLQRKELIEELEAEYYVPIDLEQSIAQNREVLNEKAAYTLRLPSFLYMDLTLSYRTTHRKFSGIWALQIRNLLNQKPVMGYAYDDFNHTVETQRSLGIIPLLSYKVEF